MTALATRREILRRLGSTGLLGLAPPLVWSASSSADGWPRAEIVVTEPLVRAAIPDHFLGFNLNAVSLDQGHGQEGEPSRLNPALIRALGAFPGAFYRYPGGNLSNHFLADAAMGPQADRLPLRLSEHRAPTSVRFGPAEYYQFLADVGGRSWYTLNLVGWDDSDMNSERSLAEVVAAATRVAKMRVALDSSPGDAHYYHLGNELDRNRYRWPPQRYVERSRAVMDAVQKADPKARFVAFLRDFDLRADRTGQPGSAAQYARQVLSGLPEVADVSLQVYYDRDAGESTRFDQAWRWKLIDRFMSGLPSQAGVPRNVWVTEHAMAKPDVDGSAQRLDKLAMTSGMAGALASVDFVLAALARGQIQATFWHALGGGVWWDLFVPRAPDLTPTPVYQVLRLLRQHLRGGVASCSVTSSNHGGYAGGYDVSAAALRPTAEEWTLLVVNRAAKPASLSVAMPQSHSLLALQLDSVMALEGAGAGTLHTLASRATHATLPPWLRTQQAVLNAQVPARSFSVLRMAPAKPGS